MKWEFKSGKKCFLHTRLMCWVSTDVLIYRYDNKGDADGLLGEEGTFNMCSFWFIEALAKNKEVDKALEYFEKMVGYSNHLGLFSEQIGKSIWAISRRPSHIWR